MDGVSRLSPAGHEALPLLAEAQLQAHSLAHVQDLLQEAMGEASGGDDSVRRVLRDRRLG